MTSPGIRAARTEDIPLICRLLEESALSPEGVSELLEHFQVALDGTILVGVIGIEHYGRDGLLRSLAVAPSHRFRGIALLLLSRAIDEARRLGIRRLVLLTTTAAGYFQRHGFRVIDRSAVSGALATSSQFQGACPSTAICMELHLRCAS